MRNVRSKALLPLLFLCITWISESKSAFADPSPAATSAIGAIVPLGGPFARMGAIVRAGIERSAPANVRVQFEDEACDPAKAVSAYRRLAASGIRNFLGPVCGSPQEALAPLLADQAAVAVLITSASRELLERSKGRMYSVQFAIEDESEFMAEALPARGVKRVAFLFGENAFSRAHERAFRARFKGQALETFTYPDGDLAGLRAVLLKIKALRPDAVYVPDVSPFLLGLAREMKNLGLGSIRLASIYAVQTDDVRQANGAALGGVWYAYPDIGSRDALEYYPARGAEILGACVQSCAQADDCVRRCLAEDRRFDRRGVLPATLVLRSLTEHGWEPG